MEKGDEKILEAYQGMLNELNYRPPRGAIVLKSKVIGTSKGRDLDSPYRAIIFPEKGKWLFRVEQKVNGSWSGTPATWRLSSLIEPNPKDFLYIDMGQKWGVRGLAEAIQEAIKHI